MTQFTENELQRISISRGIASIFSFFGSAFTILAYTRFKEIRTFAFRLVFYMAIANLCASIFGMLGIYQEFTVGIICQIQGIALELFDMSAIFWACSIAFTLHMGYLMGLESFNKTNVMTKEKWYLLFCFGVPIPVTVVRFVTTHDQTSSCWIASRHSIWRFLSFYLFAWIATLYCSFVYIKMAIKLSKIDAKSRKIGKISIHRIIYYPMVMIFIWLVPSIQVINESFLKMDPILELSMGSAVLSGLFGTINAIVYGMTPDVKIRLKQLCCFMYEPSETENEETYLISETSGFISLSRRSGSLFDPETYSPCRLSGAQAIP